MAEEGKRTSNLNLERQSSSSVLRVNKHDKSHNERVEAVLGWDKKHPIKRTFWYRGLAKLGMQAHAHEKLESGEIRFMRTPRLMVSRFVMSPPIQWTLVGLLILDILLLVTESIIETEDSHINNATEITLEVFKWISVSILIIFGIEGFALIFAWGWRFFINFFHLIDLIIVGVSLFFELYLKSQVAGLLVLFRTWRMVRVLHGVITAMEESHAHTKELLKKEHEDKLTLEEQMKKFRHEVGQKV